MSISRTGSSTTTTTQACAACKYQRRKCAPDCILAPYFPHNRQRQFLNAHKLFGVSNITKIIKNLNHPEKDEAMRSIIFQSDIRASDPVGGCYRLVCELKRQIEYSKAELDLVLQQLAMYRAQEAQQLIHPAQEVPPDDHSTGLRCENIITAADSYDVMYDPMMQYQQLHQGQDRFYDHHHHHQEQVDQFVDVQDHLNQQQPHHHDPEQDQFVVGPLPYNNNNNSQQSPHDQGHQRQEVVVQVVDDNQHLQEDAVHAWAVPDDQEQDPSNNVSSSSTTSYFNVKPPNYDDDDEYQEDMKPLLDVNDIKFDAEELVEKTFVPSAQLVISS